MRGLLFVGGMSPDICVARLFIDAVDIIVAADSGIVTAQAAGYVPDYVIGDMDSIPNPQLLNSFSQDQILLLPTDKDITDTEAAISFLRERDIDDIVMIGGSGGRIDHFFAIQKMMAGSCAPDTWIGSENLIYVCDPQRVRSRLEITGLEKSDSVSVFPSPSKKLTCKSSGLHWPIDTLCWEKDEYSLSNRCDEGTFTFESIQGRFFVILPLVSRIKVLSS